jgi:hypothetical protein
MLHRLPQKSVTPARARQVFEGHDAVLPEPAPTSDVPRKKLLLPGMMPATPEPRQRASTRASKARTSATDT